MFIAEANVYLLLLKFVASTIQILLLAIDISRIINLFILEMFLNIQNILLLLATRLFIYEFLVISESAET